MRLNCDNNILFAVCLPAFAPHNLDNVSPADHVKSQMNKVMVNGRRCTSPTKENAYSHTCNGTRYGEIMVGANSATEANATFVQYNDLESYLKTMIRPTAYAEDLEIMTLSALLKITIAVFTPKRPEQGNIPTIQCFYHPQAVATIVLNNSDGQGHYEWLNFAATAEPWTLRSRANASLQRDQRTLQGTPFQPLLIRATTFPSILVASIWIPPIHTHPLKSLEIFYSNNW